MIDILTTATRRSEIFNETVKSFRSLFAGHQTRLIINIDPVGIDNDNSSMKQIIKDNFDNYIINEPDKPSFPKAFKWCWSMAEADYVFNLEDDWKLLKRINLQVMIDIMGREQKLASLRLPWKPQDNGSMKNWKYFFPFNGLYYECPADLKRSVGFCGHPSLLHGDFVKNCVKYLRDDFNPEKQFHARADNKLMKEIDRWTFGVVKTGQKAIEDIGRQWMIKNGFAKSGNKAIFQIWEKTK